MSIIDSKIKELELARQRVAAAQSALISSKFAVKKLRTEIAELRKKTKNGLIHKPFKCDKYGRFEPMVDYDLNKAYLSKINDEDRSAIEMQGMHIHDYDCSEVNPRVASRQFKSFINYDLVDTCNKYYDESKYYENMDTVYILYGNIKIKRKKMELGQIYKLQNGDYILVKSNDILM